MKTCAEQFPVEIWLMIYRYLEAHDIFYAFHHLNYYFEQILASNYLSFYIRFKEIDTNPYWSDSVLNRTICLRTSTQLRSSYFLQFLHLNAKKLIRLQSLSININSRNVSYTLSICKAVNELSALRHLSLVCTLNENLFKSIISIQTLQICQLVLRESTDIINNQLHVNSNIKQLTIIFLSNVNDTIINLFLIHLSELKRFEVSGSYFSFQQASIFTTHLCTLSKLRILKLKLTNGHLTSDCFKYLHLIAPVLKHFYFHYNKHILSETFIDDFMFYWWPIIEQISYINIYIKGHLYIDINDNNTQMNLQKNQQILLNKMKKSNGSMKVEWTEQNFIPLKSIEINITKS
ncbi:unnamed protein product [Adineta steineri]|uniref:F-box domain-containing protein n=1 Tax=Adineta steineri TaxID=433720 RepID=A0A813NFY1_9BILA|nr:unnamed protein product [Adineta steineri]CAF3797925.1 unnamed protein product [Adineta steineri]